MALTRYLACLCLENDLNKIKPREFIFEITNDLTAGAIQFASAFLFVDLFG